jgi:hypothetical protein
MKSNAGDPWYVHAALYVVIAILSVLLIKIAIIDPKNAVEQERFWKTESRLRMNNIKAAEILWQTKNGNYTDDLETLITFIKTDNFVDSVMNAFDSLTMKSANPFKPLSYGEYTSLTVDTTINRRGKIVSIDSTLVLGTRYYLEDPDGYGSVGDLNSDALKNTSSWE